MPYALSLVVAAPAAGALLLLALPAARLGLTRAVTIAGAALPFALAVPLWFRFEPRGPQWQFVDRIGLAAAGGSRDALAVDGFGLALVLVTTLAALVSALAMAMAPTERPKWWGSALLAMEAGVLGVFVSLDLLQIFVFWQLAAASALAMIWLSQPRRVLVMSAAITLAGAAAMLAGLFLLHAHYQALASVSSFDLRAYQTLSLPPALETRVFLTLGAAFAAPAALLLAQAWSTVHRGSAPLLMLLLSAVFVKAGVLGIVRVLQPVTPVASRAFAATIVISALGAALAAGLLALRRTDFRTAVFWIGLCHLALVVAGVFAATPDALTGSMIHVLAHAVAMTALLAVAGVFISDAAGRADAGFPAGVVALAALMAAVVVSGGLTGSRMIVAGVSDYGAVARGAAGLAVVVSAIALAAAVRRALSGHAQPEAVVLQGFQLAAIAPLAALSVLIAVHPAPLLARLETSVARVIVRVSPQYAPQVADCLNQPVPPPPADSGLPAGMMLAAPCADGSNKPAVPVKQP